MGPIKRVNSYLDSKIGTFNKDVSVATIYVGNLVYYKTEVEIKELFETFGHVHYVKIIKDAKTHRSTGIAFVQMINQKDAKFAIKELNGAEVDGRTLKVSIAIESIKERRVEKRKKPYKPYTPKAKL